MEHFMREQIRDGMRAALENNVADVCPYIPETLGWGAWNFGFKLGRESGILGRIARWVYDVEPRPLCTAFDDAPVDAGNERCPDCGHPWWEHNWRCLFDPMVDQPTVCDACGRGEDDPAHMHAPSVV